MHAVEMEDLWDAGYFHGSEGHTWLRTVAGRFLRDWERRALCHGWKAGKRDRAKWKQDMAERADEDAMRGAVALAMPW